MSWIKRLWQEEEEVFAADLNNIETGIEEASGGAAVTLAAVEEVNANLTSLNLRAAPLLGLVVIVGGLEVKTEVLANGHVFTLPVGCRPEKETRMPISFMGSTNIDGGIIIEPAGVVKNAQAWKTGATPLFIAGIAALK